MNDTSAVVATGQAYSDAARTHATAIKLIRTLALVPMAVVVATVTARARSAGGGGPKELSIAAIFPWFVLGFAVGCVLSSIYGFWSSVWPFGVVELIWSGVALRRYLDPISN